jgi:AraC-like DNA-binding protein
MNKSNHATCPVPPSESGQADCRSDSNVQIGIVYSSGFASSPPEPNSSMLAGDHAIPIGPHPTHGEEDLRLLLAPHTCARLTSILRSNPEHCEFVAPAWIFVSNAPGAATAYPVEIHLMVADNVRRICLDTPDEMPNGDEKIRASAQWLTDNCEQPISVSDAARTVAMSERNFLRRFRHETGVTPSEYLLRARLNRTCKLLTESDLPIDKIARRSGMGNGAQLAKLFRKRLGISPTRFRNRARAEAATHNSLPDNLTSSA